MKPHRHIFVSERGKFLVIEVVVTLTFESLTF